VSHEFQNAPEHAMRSARRSRRRWLIRVLAVLLGLVIAVVGIEWAMRAFDLFGVNHGPNTLRYRAECLVPTWFAADGSRDLDGTLFRHKPSHRVDFGKFAIGTNALGFRGPAISKAKPAGTFRIVVLGDSVVLGWGVDDEHTFCRVVEARLNVRNDGRRYEVVNTGHNAYDSMQEAALLEREALALAPDLVLLVFITNDVVEPTFQLIEALLDGKTAAPGAPPTWRDAVVHAGQKWLPAWTALLSSLHARMGATAPSNQEAGALTPAMVPSGTLGWQRSQAALRRMRDLCAQAKIPFLLLDHTLPQLPVLAEFCRAEAILHHDFRFTPEELGQPIYNSLLDSHANAYGNELLSDKLMHILLASDALGR
jgi:lysophospholipase L1-like esterase